MRAPCTAAIDGVGVRAGHCGAGGAAAHPPPQAMNVRRRRSTVTVLRDAAESTVVEVRLVDADHLLTLATVTLRAPVADVPTAGTAP